MPKYTVYLHFELLDAVRKQGVRKREVMEFIRSLSDNPFTAGDFTDQDPSQRTRQIKIVCDHAITYWIDHAEKAVMVIDVRTADR